MNYYRFIWKQIYLWRPDRTITYTISFIWTRCSCNKTEVLKLHLQIITPIIITIVHYTKRLNKFLRPWPWIIHFKQIGNYYLLTIEDKWPIMYISFSFDYVLSGWLLRYSKSFKYNDLGIFGFRWNYFKTSVDTDNCRKLI